jgi:hypothetical protein
MRLAESMQTFRAAYEAKTELINGLRGWTKVIVLVASDCEESVALHICEGRIVACVEREREGDVVITSDLATLRDILELRRGPNEPYLFGDLLVRGPEEDFLRLDYITAVLGPT